jgi:hypothetical protein
MDAPGEKYVKVEVVRFPKFRYLKGNYKTKVSPLDRFFWAGGIGLYISTGFGIKIDSKKVYVNNVDAVVLYNLHREFMEVIHGPGGKEMAAEQWIRIGPSVLKECPRGFIFLEPGYISIV